MKTPRSIDPSPPDRTMLRIGAIVGAALTATAVLAACGVPGSGNFQRVDLPADLSETTSTTSTTLPPRTTPRTSSAPETVASTSTTEAPTTSTNPVYDVSLYFVAGPRQLTPITRQLASPAAQQVLTALSDGVPAGDEYAGLSTALPPAALLTVDRANGIATVGLPATFLTDTPAQDQTLAIAQIVLTLTQRPGIGQVNFTSDGRPQEVSRADGSLTNPGDTVVCEDYRVLAPDAACG